MGIHTVEKWRPGASTTRCLTYLGIGIAVGVFTAAGCTPASRSPTTERPEPRAEKPSATDSSAASDVYTTPYAPGQLRYDLQIFSIARALSGDSTHQSDSTRVTAIVTTTLAIGPHRNTATARVESDSISVTRGSGTSVPLQPIEPLVFTIDTRTGQVAPRDRETPPDCEKGGAESLPIYGREVLPSIDVSAVQKTWTDTLSTLACRGGALLRITRVALYTRLPLPDSVLHIARATQFQITGNGHQWNQRIEVSGAGASTDTLRFSGIPLRLQEVTGSSQTKLQFKAELRTQEFIQTSMTHITLRSQ